MRVKEANWTAINLSADTDDYGAFERYTQGEALLEQIERLEWEVSKAKSDLQRVVREYNKLSLES